jgi:hypothetical protein
MNTYARPAEGAKDQKPIKIKNHSHSKIKRSQPRFTRQLLQGMGVHPLLTTQQAER